MSHPRAARPTVRELHFFDLNYWRGRRWYERQLQRPPGRFIGESSPYYLFHPAAPKRVARLCPKVPLIALLRDPIARAWSQHRFNLATGRETLEFLDALRAEPERLSKARPGRVASKRIAHRDHSYVARGNYARQLAEWRSAVGPERLLVVRSEDLYATPDEVHRAVLSHLNVEEVPLVAEHHHGEGDPLPEDVRANAAPFFERFDEARFA